MSHLVSPGLSEEGGSPNSTALRVRCEGADEAPMTLPAHVPSPRSSVLTYMHQVARQIGKVQLLYRSNERELSGYYIPEYSLVLLGTACRRPLLCEEAQEMREQHGCHVAIVRSDDRDFLGAALITIDLLMLDAQGWLQRLRPWRPHRNGDLWLAPVQGEGRSVRIGSGLLAISPRAPFASLFEREYGFEIALPGSGGTSLEAGGAENRG